MFSHIKTSKANKLVVTQLTNKLNLGAENVIARIALAHSLAQEEQLNLEDLEDSQGKEYSKSVLFGNNYEVYLGMLCTKYNLYADDKNLTRFFKLHLDAGLLSLDQELKVLNEADLFNLIKKLTKI